MTRRYLTSKLRLGVAVAALLGLVLAAAFATGPDTASAQEGVDDPFIDLSVHFEKDSSTSTRLLATNTGTADAVGVSVDILLENQRLFASITSGSPGTTYSFEDNGEGDVVVTWEIGTLRAGVTVELELATGEYPDNATYSAGKSRAEISSISWEHPVLRHDNVAEAWVVRRAARIGGLIPRFPQRTMVAVNVNDRYPEAGDDLEFTLLVDNLIPRHGSGLDYTVVGVEVSVQLSDGLDFKPSWNPAPSRGSFVKNPDNRSGTWSAGDLGHWTGSTETMRIQARLTSQTLANIPLRERCITAWVSDMKPPLDPGNPLGRLTVCLGEEGEPTVLLESGTVGAFTPFLCIGVLIHPCRDVDGDGTSDSGLEIAAVVDVTNANLRARGLGRYDASRVDAGDTIYEVILRPENVIIRVKDPEGRIVDTQSHSVTSGTTPSWQTAREPYHQSGDREVGGATITWTRKAFNDQINDWSSLVLGASVAGLDGSAAPGRMKVRLAQSGSVLLDPNPTDERAPLNLSSPTTSVSAFFIEFEKLGTYVLDWITKANRTDTTEDPNSYTDTKTYIFHVGPIAELEVRDYGRNPTVPAGQRAFTITAVNNGPDTAPAVHVTLTGVPAGATVGSISEGSYDAATGVWTIGELETAEYRRLTDQHEGATLTLITGAAAGTEITATISNTEDYTVCIDSSGNDVDSASESACAGGGNTWHTTNYYDYITDNSTNVTIAARSGSGGTALRTTQSTTNIDLSWSPQSGAAAYGIEVSDDDGATYRLLEFWVGGTEYTHTGIPVGATRHYRVHPIYELGRRGLPFAFANAVAGRGAQEASPPGAPEQMTLNASPSSRTDILLSWVMPADYGSDITRYTLQVADARNGPWSNVNPQPGVEDVAYDYTGLSPGTRKYFRIRAASRYGSGLWSPVAEARTLPAGVPSQPQNVGATPFGDNAVSVFWDAPADDGQAAINQYEVQWSPDGSTGWKRVNSTANTSLNHTGLVAGDTYHYQVRARNSAGWGPWSQPPASTVPTGVLPPEAPYPRVEPNGSSALDIIWDPPWDDGGGAITGYQLDWSATGTDESFRSLVSPAATASSHTHTGLKPSTEYHYRMRSRNSVGWGAWSDTVSGTTEGAVPAAPTLTAQANGSTEVKLSWTRPDSGGSRIIDYELEYLDDSGRGWGWLTGDRLPSDAVQHIDSGLSPGTERQYRVRALNENGPGQWSTARTVRTDAGGPDVPVNLSAEAAATNGERRIVLTWEPPDNDNGAAVTGYRIEGSRYADGPWERLSSNHRASPYTDTRNLYPGMTRYYRIAAINRAGTGAWSDPVSGTTDDGGNPARPPDAPTAIRFTSVGQDQVSFAWDRPADDGGAPITGYEYLETFAEDTLTTTGTSGTVRGLDDGLHHYAFRVRAVNAVGEGEWSEEIFTQLWPERNEQVRVSPTNITVTEGGTFTFTVSLNRAPPLPVGLGIWPRGSDDDLLYDVYQYLDKVLIPNGWNHPDEEYREYWNGRTYNWSRGVPVTITIPDDDVDNPDRVMVLDVSANPVSDLELGIWGDEWNARWGIDPERPCPGDPDSTCATEWDLAIWRDFTGPGVKITVWDND